MLTAVSVGHLFQWVLLVCLGAGVVATIVTVAFRALRETGTTAARGLRRVRGRPQPEAMAPPSELDADPEGSDQYPYLVWLLAAILIGLAEALFNDASAVASIVVGVIFAFLVVTVYVWIRQIVRCQRPTVPRPGPIGGQKHQPPDE
jgi:hypothetical protein